MAQLPSGSHESHFGQRPCPLPHNSHNTSHCPARSPQETLPFEPIWPHVPLHMHVPMALFRQAGKSFLVHASTQCNHAQAAFLVNTAKCHNEGLIVAFIK
eukprot:11186597-Lingulodinium_polyedra.AAC.1